MKFTRIAFGLTALAFASGAVAQAHMPTRDGRAHMPIEWLLSNGQPFFYKAFESSEARPILKREPTPDEAKAITEIQRRFNTTSSVAVLLGDSEKIVHLSYKHPANERSIFLSASVDKTVTAMSAGVAVCDGKLSLDTKVRDVLPELADKDIGKSTLRQNLMMASGAKHAFADSQSFTAKEAADLWAGSVNFMDLLKAHLGNSQGYFSGTGTYSYKSQDPTVVGMMVAAAYGNEGGKYFRRWQDENFFTRVGTVDRRIHGQDHSGYAQSEGNTRMTLNDWARFAQFVSASRKETGCYGEFMRQATSRQIWNDLRFSPATKGYGYFTWTDNIDVPNSFSAMGYGGQNITWSTKNDKYFIVFSTHAVRSDIDPLAKLWLESK
jgi:CubicO group peptidase (beta-lactamase class C family)